MINSVIAAISGQQDAFNTAISWAFTQRFSGESNFRKLGERYGLIDSGILILCCGITPEEETRHRVHLVKIAANCPLEPFKFLNRGAFLRSPLEVGEMAVRYGFNFSPICKCLGEDILELEPVLRENLQRLVRATDGTIVKDALENLDPILLKEKPDEVIEISVLTGPKFDEVLKFLPTESFLEDPEPYLALARTLGEHTWGALYGAGESAPLHYANPSKATPLVSDVRTLLGDHYQQNLGEILGEIKDPGDVQGTRSSLLEAIKTGQEGVASILRVKNEGKLPEETISQVVTSLRSSAPSFLNSFQADSLARIDLRTLLMCAQFSRHSLPLVAKHLPLDLLSTDSDLIVSFFKTFRDTTWGLLARFGKDVFNISLEHASAAGEISKLCSESGGHIFLNLPPHEWGERGLRLAKKYQQTAGHLVEAGLTDEDLDLPVFEDNFQKFGIRGFHRYFLGEDKSRVHVLAENLKSLQRSKHDKKPFAIVITAHSDYNDSFGSGGLGHHLSLLTNSYQLIIFEVGSIDELGCAVQRMEKLFLDSAGRTDIAERFIFACHGSQEGLVLGEPPIGFSKERSELTVAHDDLIRSFGRLVAPRAIGFLDACSTFMGGEKADSIGNAFSREIPHAEIQGAAIPCGTEGITFDRNFKPIEWQFELHPSQFVRREAKIR